jgi:anaerobic magnesium-protoporphyrin IX monomethyl ester cyclase
MSVLLTHGYFISEDEKEKEIMKPYPPLGILCISAYLKRNRIKCEVFDTTFSSKQEMFNHLLAVKPKYICLYVNLMTRINIVRIIQFIRSHDELNKSWIILGGPEVTHHAGNFLEAGADFIVVGEGEETLTDLIRTLDVPFNAFVDQVKGIVFKNAHGQITKTPEREKIKDLDTLPLPDREAIDLSKYLTAWKQKHGANAISVNTMRGCPYTCKWCSRAVYGLSYRRRSAANVVAELKLLSSTYSPDTFWFVDDVFTVSHKWLREFRDEIKKAELTIRFECITRADRMNEEAIHLLRDSGCFRVWIGAESGSQKVIDLMDRRVEVEQVREMIILARENGIEAGTFIMLGYPGEEKEDIVLTAQHLVKSNPDLFTITVAYPIKGTAFHQEIQEDISTEQPWETTSDREIKFKRPFSDQFYRQAVRWVYNEVYYHKRMKGKDRSVLRAMRHKLNATAARLGMWWNGKRIG